MKNPTEYFNEIKEHLSTFNFKETEITCNKLVSELFMSEEEFDSVIAEGIMQILRSKKLFSLMLKVGDVLILTDRQSLKIRRLYAQALIDLNLITPAICVLNEIIEETNGNAKGWGSKEENIESKGLLGRCYKQLFIKASGSQIERNVSFIKKSINFYFEVYKSNPRLRTWHGINVVALLVRAAKENIILNGYPPAKQIAGEILKYIDQKFNDQTASAWDFATAAEACLALDNLDESLKWLSGYARMPYCDAFELASTLRQLEEVWKLDLNSKAGKLLLPLLRAELLERDGGIVSLKGDELSMQMEQAPELNQYYKSSIEIRNNGSEKELEKVFGEDSFATFKWYLTGVDRCRAVARIGRDATKGFGTGYLLNGKAIHESLIDELILITNAHVVSADPLEKALSPHEAIITFEALDRDEEFHVGELIWSSPSNKLDVTLIKFRDDEKNRLANITKGITLFPVSKYLPVIDDPPSYRVYIIGHPNGNTLQLSLQDNLLLDHQEPFIHYRTPTDGGSSGSPVFNRVWDLIGLHHAGSQTMKRLNGKLGTYQANEGIWIQCIIDSYAEHYNSIKI